MRWGFGSRSWHFNPRTSCEVRLRTRGAYGGDVIISIHAPRVRCDDAQKSYRAIYDTISIHAPRVRCDTISTIDFFTGLRFQSTHLV